MSALRIALEAIGALLLVGRVIAIRRLEKVIDAYREREAAFLEALQRRDEAIAYLDPTPKDGDP